MVFSPERILPNNSPFFIVRGKNLAALETSGL